MLRFPRSGFNSRRLKANDGHASCGRFLALGLSALLFLAPLSFPTHAQQPASHPKFPEGNQFTIYRDENGDAVCRIATPAERARAGQIDPGRLGLRRINHLKRPGADNAQTGENDETGLTIILNGTAQLQQNPTAVAAFNRAAQNWENIIRSPITITINVDYGPTDFGEPWDADVLGSTGTRSQTFPYQSVRANLIAEAVGEGNATKQAIFNALPATTVPTNLGDSSTTDVSDPIARAIGLLPAVSTGSIAHIAFNSNFDFDFNPDNGIGTDLVDFDAVATHELGHALGLSSDAGAGSSRPAVWDLYRFRSGTTSGTFTTAQRVMTVGGSPSPLQFYFLPGNPELGLSTGGPSGSTSNGGDGWQSSHWKHTNQCTGSAYIGIMDPAIGSGCRRAITSNDALALGSFGYNLNNSNAPPPPPPPTPPPANDNFTSARTIVGCTASVTGTTISSTTETGEPSHDPSDPDSHSPGHTVWYQWQAPSTGRTTITTQGSDFDTILAVYTGSNLGSLTRIVFNDDVQLGVITTSTVSFNATTGVNYLIAVDGYDGDTGTVKLNWSESNCTQATTVQFSQASFTAAESAGSLSVTVNRADQTAAASVSYATSDTAGLSACNQTNTGVASSRCDYATTVGTLSFAAGEASRTISIPVVDDGYVEGPEGFTIRLSNPVGMSLGANSTATVTITDNDTAPANPIAGVAFFVRQQYIDFLGREPDPGGYAAWQNILNSCAPNDTSCDRISVSSGFFRSPEFQERGYFVFRFYPVALGRNPSYAEFMPDLAKVSGFLDAQQLDANKTAFVNEFMLRAEFANRYGSLGDTAFVDALLQTAGLTNVPGLSVSLKQSLATGASRAQVLRNLVDGQDAYNKFYNEAFVRMQYFGYLRRDPDALYAQWVQTLNLTGDFRTMLNGFINSNEYVLRFGP